MSFCGGGPRFPSLAGFGFPSLAGFGFPAPRRSRLPALRFPAPRRSRFSLARRLGFPSLGGSVSRGLAVRGVFLRPVPVCPCPPPLGWAGGGRRWRPPLRGSSCPRSPLILLETSQTFFWFKALAAAAAPARPLFGLPAAAPVRSAAVGLCAFSRPPAASGVFRFLFRAREKSLKKSPVEKMWKKIKKIPKMSIFLPPLCQKKEKCLNYFQKILDILPRMWYNIGKKT